MIVAATSLFVTSTTGAWPVTVTDSCRVVRFMTRFCCSSRLTVITRFVTVAVVNERVLVHDYRGAHLFFALTADNPAELSELEPQQLADSILTGA